MNQTSSNTKLISKKFLRKFSKLPETSSRTNVCELPAERLLDKFEMQKVYPSADLTENTNSSGIDCKCSSIVTPILNDRSYGVNGRKSEFYDDEIVELRRQVGELNQTMVHLQTAVQLKDSQLERLHNDVERLSSELKKKERCNRNLKQQLDDERYFYQKEKEHFCDEIKNNKIFNSRVDSGSSRSLHQQRIKFDNIRDALEEENKELRDELIEKNETTYNLCIKFIRMKHAKDTLRHKLDQLVKENLRVMAEMMEKLDEAREELNIIVSEKFQEPLHLSKAKFLQVVQRNSRLVHENAALRLQSHQLTQSIEKLKSESQKTKTINVDARTIAKLAMQGWRKRREEKIANSLSPTRSDPIKLENEVASRYSLSTSCCRSVDSSGDAKISSNDKHRTKHATFDIPEVEEQPEKLVELRTERTQSAPEIVQTVTFKQDSVASGNGSEYTESTERGIEVRDMYTNT